MKYQEEWSERAKSDLLRIMNYIINTWSKKEAEKFISGLEHTMRLILRNPRIGKVSERRKDLYKFVFSPQTSIIYRIKSNTIRVITLLDNRADPKKHSF